MKKQRIDYNAPVILTFTFLAVGIFLVGLVIPGFKQTFFILSGRMGWLNPFSYIRLFTHVLGHADWQHLMGNMTFILLLGPMMEEKYGSQNIFGMICVTALITGLVHVIFFNNSLLGASGVVFMLIVLASMVDIKAGKIPLTLILISLIFIGDEVVAMFQKDNVSQITHIVGGIVGALMGYSVIEPSSKEDMSSFFS